MSFEETLAEFSGAIGAPCSLDENNSCLLELEDGLKVQIEPSDDQILVGMMLGQAPAGRSMEPFFRACLVENGLPAPRFGTLAWSRKSGELVLFDFVPMESGEKLADQFHGMVEKGRKWKGALQRGEVPTFEAEP